VELFDLALAVPGSATAMRARAHAFRARPGPLHLFDVSHAERAETIATELGRPLLVAFSRHVRGIGAWWHGDLAQAIELSRDAADRFDAAGRTLEWGDARKFLGVAMVFDGDVIDGLEVQHDALLALRRVGAAAFQVAHGVAYLGHCHRMLGDDAAALADWTEARELCRSVGNRGTAVHIELGLADLAVDRGDVDDALARAAEALDLIHEARGWIYEPWAWTVALRAHGLTGDAVSAAACGRRAAGALPRAPSGEEVRLAQELAELAVQHDEIDTAARLLGIVDAVKDRRELPFPPKAERLRLQALREVVAARLGPAWRDDVTPGARLSITEAAGSLLVP
jgi:tetratricopeptide (TPR) repeat protein